MMDLMYHPFTQAMGSTVLHSLWQATLLAIVLWALSRRKGLSPNKRYWLGFTALFAQLVASAVTLAWVYEPSISTIQEMTVFEWTAGATDAIVTAYTAGDLGIAELDWMEKVYFGLALVWLLGLAFGSIRLLSGHLYLQLRFGRGGNPVPASWQPVLQQLIQRLDQRPSLARKVRLSNRINSPALIGLFKPLILFPVSVVNHLEPDEVEALLAHELSHYASKDHWWNFLQTLIEVLFYFNPAVHWIGKRIREEREFRCDQRVGELGISTLVYATALYKIEEQCLTPKLALSARPGSLLGRVERMLLNTPNYYHMKPGLLIFLLLMIGTLFSSRTELTNLLAADNSTEITDLDYRSSSACGEPSLIFTSPEADTLPPTSKIKSTTSESRQMIIVRRAGEDVEVTKINGEITELKINGKAIPPAEYDQHNELLAEIDRVRPPAPPTPPMPPNTRRFAPPVPPAPPAPPAPPVPNGDEFIMDISEEAMTFVFPDSDSMMTMNFSNIGKLGWIGELGELIEDAIVDGEVTSEAEAEFEAAVEGWAESLLEFKMTTDELDDLRSEFRMTVREVGEEENIYMEFRDDDGNVEIIEVPKDEDFNWNEHPELQLRLERDMEKLEERLNHLDINLDDLDVDIEEIELEDIERLRDIRSADWFSSDRSSVHRISSQRFVAKVEDFQDRGLIKHGDINKFFISKDRMKINGKRVSQDVFNRYVKEYSAEYGIEWDALDNFEIDVKL